jgi:hypothetical protein
MKHLFPATHTKKSKNYSKHKEPLQGYFPKLPQTQELPPSSVVMLTQRTQELHNQNSKMNEKTTEIQIQTNKRKCTGMGLAY